MYVGFEFEGSCVVEIFIVLFGVEVKECDRFRFKSM